MRRSSSISPRRGWTQLLALTASITFPATALADPPFVQQGKAGFVVSDIKFVLAPDAKDTGACKEGMSLNVEQIFALTPEGKRHAGEPDKDYAQRLREGAIKLSTAPNGQNVCQNPEAAGPDPYFRSLDVNSPGAAGNHFSRVVGCTTSYQSTGLVNSFAIEMLTGSWGILIELRGVHNIHDDPNVEVGIFANADPIQLSADRKPLANATYAIDQDKRFRAWTHGQIKNGVLTTDPVDVRFHNVVNSMHLERPLLHARLRATISDAGVLTGNLSGYTPVEAFYDFQFGFRNAKTDAGQPSPLRLKMISSNGAARVLDYTCPGIYHTLIQDADGDRDPRTGRYTSISTQYQLSAIPAFVVDVATKSANAGLVNKAPPHAP
jgi:hypothetical protein